MDTRDRIYRRTRAGEHALRSATVGIAEGEYRRILGLIQGEMHFDLLRASLREHSIEDLSGWLVELERRGLIAARAAAPADDLDFTGNFSVTDLAAAHNKRR